MWTDTKPHRMLQQELNSLGIEFINEACFGTKAIDCYSPELHIGFEADGFFHQYHDDIARDNELYKRWRLKICHITEDELNTSCASHKILEFILINFSQDDIDYFVGLNKEVKQGSCQSLSERMKHLWEKQEYRDKITEAGKRRRTPNVEKKCEYCGKTIMLPYKRRANRFCGNSCATKYKHKIGSLGTEGINAKISNGVKESWKNLEIIEKHKELPKKGEWGCKKSSS